MSATKGRFAHTNISCVAMKMIDRQKDKKSSLDDNKDGSPLYYKAEVEKEGRKGW